MHSTIAFQILMEYSVVMLSALQHSLKKQYKHFQPLPNAIYVSYFLLHILKAKIAAEFKITDHKKA